MHTTPLAGQNMGVVSAFRPRTRALGVQRRLVPKRRLDGRKQEISGRYLSEDERVLIVDRHGQGETVCSITAALDRSPSMISREVRRDAIRAVGSTDRSERIGSPRPDGLSPERGSWPSTRCCQSSSSPG